MASGTQQTRESHSALRHGQEGIKLLVGQAGAELVHVVVGPPIAQFHESDYKRLNRVPHRLTGTVLSKCGELRD